MSRKVTRIENTWNKYSLDTAAKPTDTYTAPKRPSQDSEYKRIAVALAGIHEPLTKFTDNRIAEKEAQDKAKGIQMFHESGQNLSWADYRDTNEAIPNNQSMKAGYLMARMSNEADLLRNVLHDAYNRGEAVVRLPNGETINVAQSDDPTAFNSWLRESIKNYINDSLGDDIPPEIFTKVFVPQMEEYSKEITKAHLNNRANVIQIQLEAEMGTLVKNTIMRGMDDGSFILDDDEQMSLQAQLSAQAQEALKSGLTVDQVKSAMLSMALSIADDDTFSNTDDLFPVINGIEIAPGVKLGDFGDVRMLVNKTALDAERRREAKEEKEKKKREEEQEKQRNLIYLDFLLQAAQGVRMSKNQMQELIKRVSGEVSDEEVAAFVRNFETIYNSVTPQPDNYMREVSRSEMEWKRVYEYQRAVGGNITPENVFEVGLKQFKIPYRIAVQLTQGAPEMNGAFGAVQQQYGSFVKDLISTLALDERPIFSDPATMSKGLAINDVIWSRFQREVEKDATLLSNHLRAQEVLMNITKSTSLEYKDTPFVLFKGYETGNEDSLKNIERDNTNFNMFHGKGVEQKWVTAARDYNEAVKLGGNPADQPLMIMLRDRGIDKAEFERQTGLKLFAPQASSSGHVTKNTRKKKPPAHKR